MTRRGSARRCSRLLRASGLEAESYASGQEFLDAAAERRPDCVVLDLHMPGMSGLQVLRKLKAAGQRLSIVIITAHDEPETREQCLGGGRLRLPAQAARGPAAAQRHLGGDALARRRHREVTVLIR